MPQIPAGWEETTLGNVIELIIDHRGQTPKKLGGDWTERFWYRAISAKSIKNGKLINEEKMNILPVELYKKWMKTEIEFADVFLTSEAPLWEHMIWKSKEKLVLSQRIFWIRTQKNLLDPFYFNYFIDSNFYKHELFSRESGSTVTGIKQSELIKTKVLLPPLPEQQAIAAVLSSFDDKIELLRAENQTLEQMGQELFKERFGKWKIGDELPEGWRVGKLGEMINEVIAWNYGQEIKDNVFCIETKCLRWCDLPDMRKWLPKNAPIRYLKEQKINGCKLINWDIVIEISWWTENQSTWRTMYINSEILNAEQLPMTCVNFCKIIRPKKIVYSYFMYLYLNILYQKWVFFNIENGTTWIKNLDMKALMNLEIIIPNQDSFQEFNDFVKKLYMKIQTNNTQIEALSATRDLLLPKLMSGEVRVEF